MTRRMKQKQQRQQQEGVMLKERKPSKNIRRGRSYERRRDRRRLIVKLTDRLTAKLIDKRGGKRGRVWMEKHLTKLSRKVWQLTNYYQHHTSPENIALCSIQNYKIYLLFSFCSVNPKIIQGMLYQE